MWLVTCYIFTTFHITTLLPLSLSLLPLLIHCSSCHCHPTLLLWREDDFCSLTTCTVGIWSFIYFFMTPKTKWPFQKICKMLVIHWGQYLYSQAATLRHNLLHLPPIQGYKRKTTMHMNLQENEIIFIIQGIPPLGYSHTIQYVTILPCLIGPMGQGVADSLGSNWHSCVMCPASVYCCSSYLHCCALY